jgi:hypothetical protein
MVKLQIPSPGSDSPALRFSPVDFFFNIEVVYVG